MRRATRNFRGMWLFSEARVKVYKVWCGVESGLDETVTARYRTRFILDEGRKHMSDRLYEEGGFHIPIPLV
jgi:hypothetical protein